ncbi:MAG: PorP/SprF family type IX secretion system membrane protein [Salinivirgaceae bacterium]|nr:PorP/SprF family type IX secretion system membrane protein [Salinivirgaceae bacterium]
MLSHTPKHIAAILVLCCMCTMASAQDSPLSQWCNNMLVMNPAFAGSADMLRLNLFYRNQWPQSDAGFQYFGATADMPVKQSMGCGIEATNDRMSFYVRRSFAASYSYRVKAGTDRTIFMGIKLGAVQKSLSTSNLIFEQQEDLPSEASKVNPDCALGVAAMLGNVFASAAAEHLLRPDQSFLSEKDSRTKMKLTFDLGYVYNFSPLTKKIHVEIMPNFIYQRQGKQQNMQIGVTTQVNWLLASLFVRKNFGSDAPSAIIMLGYKNLDFRIAYSYDADLNRKTNGIGNAHEVSVTKLFDVKRKEKKKSIECPSFLR